MFRISVTFRLMADLGNIRKKGEGGTGEETLITSLETQEVRLSG